MSVLNLVAFFHNTDRMVKDFEICVPRSMTSSFIVEWIFSLSSKSISTCQQERFLLIGENMRVPRRKTVVQIRREKATCVWLVRSWLEYWWYQEAQGKNEYPFWGHIKLRAEALLSSMSWWGKWVDYSARDHSPETKTKAKTEGPQKAQFLRWGFSSAEKSLKSK